jgi:Ca2+-binding RTX toxin-like protein
VRLGAGADAYRGGAGADDVRAAQIYDPSGTGGPIHDLDVDIIDTGDGDARILSGYITATNADRITVGDGDAQVEWEGIPGPGGFVNLGAGTHGLTVVVNPHGLPVNDWVIDASGRQETPIEDRLVNVSGLLSHVRVVGRLRAGATLTYLGSENAEHVRVNGLGGNLLFVRPKGGADHVMLACNSLTARSSFSAGPGDDTIVVNRCRNARIDLDGHRLNSASLRGFERVDVRAETIDLRGNEASNRLTADGCQVRVDGRRGADNIVVRTYPRDVACEGTRSVDGGPGDDHMVGSLRADVLVGGKGFDQAYGRGGVDTCRAEVTRLCEKR